jgi:hypothetical protein
MSSKKEGNHVGRPCLRQGTDWEKSGTRRWRIAMKTIPNNSLPKRYQETTSLTHPTSARFIYVTALVDVPHLSEGAALDCD